ncbi:pentatricopeptide repeat-containing protein At3g20730-like [Olea europaea var. sylvestris]|uniref:pentatricopeptide repeat-containing protein At3g20730-like n=1 Tax=Olea europaea var. sylvestris TaxID=158386 RepID=UPI000C1D79B1|nr:pentatricopeptide repeat-containing protein At3g20730-like [Olea europaea var. sylvestris]
MHNKAIDNLIKAGSFVSALKLFYEMPKRDVVTWNIMVSGHYRNGLPIKSLYFYNQMVSEGIVENPSTFSSVLSVCCNAGLYREGLVVHCRAIILGLSMNIYISSVLADLYMKMGVLDIALKLFNNLPERNLATWNVILRGFCDMGRTREMLRLLRNMVLEAVEPNGLSFCYFIRGSSYERCLDEGMQLHCCVTKKGLVESNLFVANALVDFYSACGSVVDAWKSFQVIPPEDVISWNSMISVCASNGFLIDALEFFERMHFWGKKPSACSFLGFLKLAGATKNIILGNQIHCCVLKLGLDIDSVLVLSALIDMYGKCGDIESSVDIFENVPKRALECCNSLMTSLLRCGLIDDVIELFGLMIDEQIGYDEVSLSSTLKALAMSTFASSTSCMLLHCHAIKSGYESDNAVSCSLIDAYSRSGEVRFSRQVFNQLSLPNSICFTSIISALARNGMGMECLVMFHAMIQNGLKPDEITFLCILMGCNHSGLVEEGKSLFYLMQNDYGILPDRRHYSCMIDLLGRVGLLDEAEQLLKEAPRDGKSAIWSSMLRSCRIHQNEQVGKRAAATLMDLEPEHPAAWLQASSFYSEIGDFDSATRFQEVAVARKIRRDIGHSLIEVHGHRQLLKEECDFELEELMLLLLLPEDQELAGNHIILDLKKWLKDLTSDEQHLIVDNRTY